LQLKVKLAEGWCEMTLPVIAAGTALRAGAKKLAEKFGKKESENLLELEAKKKAAEESRKKLPAKVAAGAGLGAVGAAEIGGGLKNKEIKERQAQKEAKDEMRREARGKEVKNDRSIEVPTEENMNRPKATRPGGADFKKGGSVSSASKRGDGIAMKGKTRGRMV